MIEEANSIALNEQVCLDIPTLLETKLLIQANSGGGKTYLVRRMLEQSHNKLQHFVIDIEGGLRTIREQYEYVIIGASSTGADFLLSHENAAQLAQMFLRFRTSVIMHLGGFPNSVRQEIVKSFLESLMQAPEELWHSALVVVDEAHIFCPQDSPAVAAEAVKDLCARGRYRGFCPVLATQRVTKLHNDAIAECNNKFFGRASLPADRKRSNEELNFAPKSKTLETLSAGTFYGFGPALLPSHQVQEILVGPVVTTHPRPGSRIKSLPPPESMVTVLEALQGMFSQATEEPIVQKEQQKRERQSRRLQTSTPTDILSLQNQYTLAVQQNEWLQRKVKEQEMQIAALLQVTSFEQQIQATKLQTAHVHVEHIEHATFHQFNSGVATEEQIQQKQKMNGVPINEKKLEAFKTWLAKHSYPYQRKMLFLLYEERKAMSAYEIASWLGYAESSFQKPPSQLMKKGLLTRTDTREYQSTLEDFLRKEFPGSDIETIVHRLEE